MHNDNGLIHTVKTTAANLHDLTPAAELLHGGEEVVYAVSGCQGIHKWSVMAGKKTTFRVAMRSRKRRTLPESHEGRRMI